MIFNSFDNEWHDWFAWYPVYYQSDYGGYSWVWLEWIKYKEMEIRRAYGMGPVYRTKKSSEIFLDGLKWE